MKVAIVSGSHRLNSESEKVSKYLGSELNKKGVEHGLINLAGNPFPLWDESVWAGGPWAGGVFEEASKTLSDADGVIVVSPEWNGMVTPALKNFFLLCGVKELGHKPGLIVSVSAGRGGAYPVLELRSSGYKNSRFCYMPDHLIVRDVKTVLNAEASENPGDAFIRDKIDYTLDVFSVYMTAFKDIRKSPVIDFEKHGNGMS